MPLESLSQEFGIDEAQASKVLTPPNKLNNQAEKFLMFDVTAGDGYHTSN
jgi:hypothetical protein